MTKKEEVKINKSLQIHEIIGCEVYELEKTGVFNAYRHTDNPYFIHPNLLYYNKISEFQGSFDKITQQIVSVFDTMISVDLNTAVQKFKYPEPPYTYIGHGEESGRSTGKGLVGSKARKCLEHFNNLIQKNTTIKLRGDIFQLIPLFQKGIGCDLISDLMFWILREEFFKYTARVCKELNIQNTKSNKDTYGQDVFFFENQPLVFYPFSILTKINDKNYVDNQITINEEVRSGFNDFMGKEKATIGDIKEFANSNIKTDTVIFQILDELKKQTNIVQDIRSSVEEMKKELAKELGRSYDNYNPDIPLKEQFLKACGKFQHKIEYEGLAKWLYDNDNDKIKHENYIRDLFYLSLSWWNPTNIQIVKEQETGRGSTDLYIISTTGSKETIVYELKLSSNQQTIHGYEYQLPQYMFSTKCDQGVFMLVQVNTSATCQYDKFKNKLNDKNFVNPNIECIFIDGRLKTSASKKDNELPFG